MRSVLRVTVVIAFFASGCGGEDEAPEMSSAEAVAVVEREWGDCLRLAGESTESAEARVVGDEIYYVRLTNGATFAVGEDDLEGARALNSVAKETLDQASAAGGDC